MYTKIYKPTAQKLYEKEGKTIILAPKNCGPTSTMAIKANRDIMGPGNFRRLCEVFQYYNGSCSFWVAP